MKTALMEFNAVRKPSAATMRAFVMKRIGEVGFMEKPLPQEPGANGAIIKTTSALICTSDAHTVGGAIGERENLTLGHEAVGIVYKLGREVKGVREGNRVAVNAITPCYTCTACAASLRSALRCSADGSSRTSKMASLPTISR